MMDFFYACAIPKGQEQHWNQTPWGQQILAAGVEGWPGGEHNNRFFAWKVVDGDSTEIDQGGRAPCAKEGFPGHWIVKINSGFPTPCWHAGRLQAHEVIQNKNEIKCGDYMRAKISVRGNGPVTKSPGVYINPMMFELSRPGLQILSASIPDAGEAFGSSQAQLPNNAQVDNSVQNGGYEQNNMPQQQQQNNMPQQQQQQQNNMPQQQQQNNMPQQQQQQQNNMPQQQQQNNMPQQQQQNNMPQQQQQQQNNMPQNNMPQQQQQQQKQNNMPQQQNNMPQNNMPQNNMPQNQNPQGHQQADQSFLNNGNG
jgi:hypothetical protein